MKHIIRILAAILTLVLVMGCLSGCSADAETISAQTEAITTGVVGGVTSGVMNGLSQGLIAVDEADVAGTVSHILTAVGIGVVDGIKSISSHVDTDKLRQNASSALKQATEYVSDTIAD